jgi:hypothetical protein
VALAREHGVSRGAIRTAVADLLPDQPERPAATAVTATQAVLVEIPGKIARYLDELGDLGETEQRACARGARCAAARATAFTSPRHRKSTRRCSPPRRH